MKRSRVLWAGVVLAVIVVVLAVFLLGRAPFTVPVWSALPAVEESIPHLLLAGRGEDMPSPGLLGHLEQPLPEGPLMERLKVFLPLLKTTEQFALLLSAEEGIPEIYGAFYPDRHDLEDLKKGKLPASWIEDSPRSRLETGEGGPVLSAEGDSWSVALRVRDRMVLFSQSTEGLDRMEGILESGEPSLDVSWTLRPEWTSHLRINDAGYLGDLLFMAGIEAGTDTLSAEAAWRSGPEGSDLAWQFGGVDDLLSKWGFPEGGFSGSWTRPVTLPSPGLLTLGVNLPQEFLLRFGDRLQRDWAEDLDLSATQSEALLSGPMVLSLGGRSKLFLFSGPGMTLQLFDRGRLGRELVEGLWNGSWSSMSERRESIEGFPFGGGVSRPFSVIGAAAEDRVIVGLLDPRQIAEKKVPSDVLPFDPEGSFLWFYGDFPELSSALKKWARLGEYARSAGFEVGEMGEVFDGIESLRSVGRLSLVLQSPFEGQASWTGADR